jgi:hypothetical protein
MNQHREKQINYDNWVSKKFIYLPTLLAAVFLGLSFLSLFFLIGTFFFLIPAVNFSYAYFQYSFQGANLQAKIRDLALNQLSWKGEGKLLDIGCGSVALAIEAA